MEVKQARDAAIVFSRQTKSLTHDETYAVTAYLLYLNEIIGENDVTDATTLPKVKMPIATSLFNTPRSKA